MDHPRHFPTTFSSASVLVVPQDHGGTVSGVLVARDCGYLAVRVQFHGHPVAGLQVRFFLADGSEARGDAVGEAITSDEDGVARAARVVPAGLYVCAVEKQNDLVVPTVADFDDAYPVVLPVGRSYVDMHDGLEFAAETAEGADDSGRDGDDDGDGDGDENDGIAPDEEIDQDAEAAETAGPDPEEWEA